MKKLVIAGGAGFLGQVLARHFKRKTWEVVVLTRAASPQLDDGRPVAWDGASVGPWIDELAGADALVNLCGRSVDCRYHRRNREEILQSRLLPTRALAKALAQLETPPPVWVNASSATIYRHSLDRPMDEAEGELGRGFSVEVCQAWEDAFFTPELPGTRRVALRASMVLGRARNSVFPVLARLARLGLGGKFSSGKQMMSWIHETDFARVTERAIDDDSLAGPLNVTAPAPLPNAAFMKALRDVLHVPFGLPHLKAELEIAAWLMRTETELTLKSRYVIPAKLLQQRFVFRYPFLEDAMANLAEDARTAELAPALFR